MRHLIALLLLAACTTLGAAPADKPTADKPDGFWREWRGLRLGIEADMTSVQVGQKVRLTVVVNNPSEKAIGGADPNEWHLYLFDGNRFYQPQRLESPSDGGCISRLRPGETRRRTIDCSWKASGMYKVHFVISWASAGQSGQPQYVPLPPDKAHLSGLPGIVRLTNPYGLRPASKNPPRTHDLVINVTE